jgi:hypothetical protein
MIGSNVEILLRFSKVKTPPFAADVECFFNTYRTYTTPVI